MSDQPRNWEWSAVKAALAKNGVRLKDVADICGINRSNVTMVKVRASRRVQNAIARQIGVPGAAIWPDRYRPDEELGRRRPRGKP